MATAKRGAQLYTNASIAANARLVTPEYDTNNCDWVYIHFHCTHALTTGGFTLIPVGRIAGSWFPFSSVVSVTGQTGGIQTGPGILPPYSTYFAQLSAAFGPSRQMAFFINPPTVVSSPMAGAMTLNCTPFDRVALVIENYGSTLTNATVFVSAGGAV